MIDPSKYIFRVREDFSMVALDKKSAREGRVHMNEPCYHLNNVGVCCKSGPCKLRTDDDMCLKWNKVVDRQNSANDGYKLGGGSKRKIRSAVNALYLSNVSDRDKLRFVTFTFPPLPEHMKQKTLREQDQFLYGIFKKFLNNERKNYKLVQYVWVNERQKETRDVIHFHCLFRYGVKRVNYEETNLRFLNLLGRNGFDIYSYGFRLDTYASRRDLINKKLARLDYQYFKENKTITKFKTYEVRDGEHKEVVKSVFFQPVDFEKPIKDVVQLAYYLSKYISKDDEKEKVYCRRWASSRGLFELKADIFNEFDDTVLLELYRDITSEEKKKGGYDERRLEPMQFEYVIDGVTFTGYYFPPCFRKWSLDPSMQEYFRDKFNFYLTT